MSAHGQTVYSESADANLFGAISLNVLSFFAKVTLKVLKSKACPPSRLSTPAPLTVLHYCIGILISSDLRTLAHLTILTVLKLSGVQSWRSLKGLKKLPLLE